MNTTVRKLSYILILAATIFGATACNTMHGVGKDTEQAGKEIQEESREHKH